jgi:DNA-binding MarR family transcriptional regulator
MSATQAPRDDAQQVLDSIRKIVRELRVSARAAEEKIGLSGAQLFVLARLAEARGLSLGELAERTLTDPSSVSVVVGRLVEAGLVARKRSEQDERRLELTLTPAGRALARKAPSAAQERLVRALGELGAGKRRTLAQLLAEVVSRMGLETKAARLFFEEEARVPRGKGARAARGAGAPVRARSIAKNGARPRAGARTRSAPAKAAPAALPRASARRAAKAPSRASSREGGTNGKG